MDEAWQLNWQLLQNLTSDFIFLFFRGKTNAFWLSLEQGLHFKTTKYDYFKYMLAFFLEQNQNDDLFQTKPYLRY